MKMTRAMKRMKRRGMKRRMGVKRTRTNDVHEEDEVPEHERRRRRVLHATALRVKKLHALERKDPYSLLPVVHLTDLYNSPRFADIDAGMRYAILVHVLHHHHLHLLASNSAVDVSPPVPYLRRRGRGLRNESRSRFIVSDPPKADNP